MIPEDHIKLICEYEWLRMLADDLDVMSLAVDRCLIDLEHRLPDYYQPEFRLSKRLLALMGAKKYPLHCFRQGSQNGEDTHGFYGIVLRRG